MVDNAVIRATAHLQEAIREIHIMAGFNRDDDLANTTRPTVIGVTSADYGDGKTTVAIALAASLTADFGAEVTLVDADLHTHSIGREFGLQDRGGVTNIVEGSVALADARYPSSTTPHLTIISAGTATIEAARVAHSQEFRQMLSTVRSQSEFVVVDLPATLHSMTAPILMQRCDGIVVVARAGHTTTRDLERTINLLRDANVLGVVINRMRSRIPGFVERALNLRS